MASYSINISFDGTYFTPVALRNPTLATGGTSCTILNSENVNGSYTTVASKHLDDAIFKAMRAVLLDRATNGD